jgi:hypothetical protein
MLSHRRVDMALGTVRAAVVDPVTPMRANLSDDVAAAPLNLPVDFPSPSEGCCLLARQSSVKQLDSKLQGGPRRSQGCARMDAPPGCLSGWQPASASHYRSQGP